MDTDALTNAKTAAARAAVEVHCRDGMRLGLGSGTTSRLFLRALAERVREGLDVVGVPSSTTTAALALELGIPLVNLDEVPELDLTVDSAVQIDRRGNMVKGAGGSFLHEKVVARASARMVVIVDDTKVVPRLGGSPVPIEVVPFGRISSERLVRGLLRDLGCGDVALTWRTRDGKLTVTDGGHYVVDAYLEKIDDASTLARQLNEIPGVVESGLFVAIASELVVGHPDGSAERLPLPMPVQRGQ